MNENMKHSPSRRQDSMRVLSLFVKQEWSLGLGGTFALTKYKGKWFELNTPQIYRLIRDKIKND
ncbi:hypothetical protein [Bacillus sp. EB600]|uniref:hypothetical protein n=1 Tax=Bacillus sp. EB600 TaxID=2806345 RepID=UPI00210C1543|nr:hypothetical protein [Bacillus sp. EB600]MCQ6282369.1 hypothetical protein [Bacillus sp. EB600]